MTEEKRTCKTCCCFNAEANFCRCRDSSHAEWDTCDDHETREEFDARMKAKREKEIRELNETTDSFTIGDSLKYSCIHEGKKLIIGDWELFDKDWGTFKDKTKKLETVQSSIDTVRNALYDALPTGEVDAFELIKVINAHISKLDMILETLK